MDTPQEIEVWYILPALRQQLAAELKKKGVQQNKIADMLGITPAAVSQYLTKKRGNGVMFQEKMQQEVKRSALAIMQDPKSRQPEYQRLLSLCRSDRYLCRACNDHLHTSMGCNVCFEVK